MKPRFVPFEIGMADGLVRMWREAFEHGVGVVDPHPIDGQRAYFIEQVLPRHRVTVALDEADRTVGFVAANAASIGQLHVRVSCHGQGIGSALLERAKADSVGSLWLYTFARNTRARRFYEGRGIAAGWLSASSRPGSSKTCATSGGAPEGQRERPPGRSRRPAQQERHARSG